jgi:hypothetical protein
LKCEVGIIWRGAGPLLLLEYVGKWRVLRRSEVRERENPMYWVASNWELDGHENITVGVPSTVAIISEMELECTECG